MLSPTDLKAFEEQGFMMIRGAVDPAGLQAVKDAIFWFMECAPEDRKAWYQKPYDGSGTLEMYQHQALWDNRQNPALYEAFCEIFGQKELWVSMDRVGFKPPSNDIHDHKGFLHVDADPHSLPIPFGVQGVLYLEDTEEDMGGFHCLPGWHKRGEEWAPYQPRMPEPRGEEAWRQLPVQPIAGKAGDFLIWNRALPHGSGQNQSQRLRLSQYISMRPAEKGRDGQAAPPQEVQNRIRLWRERLNPPYDCFPGDPRKKEVRQGKTARLSSLGRRLLGLDSWN